MLPWYILGLRLISYQYLEREFRSAALMMFATIGKNRRVLYPALHLPNKLRHTRHGSQRLMIMAVSRSVKNLEILLCVNPGRDPDTMMTMTTTAIIHESAKNLRVLLCLDQNLSTLLPRWLEAKTHQKRGPGTTMVMTIPTTMPKNSKG